MKNNNELIFCPLGGSGEIGMNMNLYGYGEKNNHQWIIIDIGVGFVDDSVPGIDLMVPDPDFILQRKDDLLGILLTHAHEDHIGAIALLWPSLECPIYATPFTATLIKEKFREKKINIGSHLKIIELNGNVKIGPFDINYVTLTHSILEPNALQIKTPHGTLLHTGDWKCDTDPLIGKQMDEIKLKEIGKQGVLAMICDSTNIFTEGRSGSEKDVRESMLTVFENIKKKIIVTTFASNVARMETVFKCAEKVGRHLSLVGRSMHRIYNTARECGYLQNIKPPLDPRDAKKIPRDKIVYLCTGSQGEPLGAMNRIVNQEHPDVYLDEGDTVIFSSRIIPGNEKKLFKIHNQLVKNNINVISEENAFIHVSGHPGRDEMRDMYEWIKPKISIPVHGEHRHMKEHYDFATSLGVPQPMLIENGDMIRIAPGEPKIIDKVHNGKLYVDGNRVIDDQSRFLKDRKNIAHNGLMDVTLIISKKGNLDRNPIINIRGLPFNDEELDECFYEMEDEILKTSKAYSLNNKKHEKNLIDALKSNLKKIIYSKTRKRPYTNITLIRV
ncbi:MAG: ribonuclease J [Proteobacteria bacterium]|jgi:ribonuclease J|nr:ribonuclease J [Pseudomonadota bacterium]